jgi:hypothetical protein
MPNTLDEKDWNILLRRIKLGKCTPFLGAGASYGTIPLGSEIARAWALEFDYPLDDAADLVRVAQYVAVDQDPMFPKEELAQRIRTVSPPDFKEPTEPHALMADLPLPVYITTNYDDFMYQALKDRRRDPRQELCKWNKYVKGRSSVLDIGNSFEATPANPVVYHLHGVAQVPESLVLTEDDYLDFLANISKKEYELPVRIQEAFTGASLLFLGYRIADWDFRVLFRGLQSYLERSLARAHISVQIVPLDTGASLEQKEKAQRYLDKYFKNIDTRIYWGTCEEFVTDLRQRWEDFNRATYRQSLRRSAGVPIS